MKKLFHFIFLLYQIIVDQDIQQSHRIYPDYYLILDEILHEHLCQRVDY